ncbi:hypothetical protein ACHAXR_011298 [Thalassiosira sp. AJA248-18]
MTAMLQDRRRKRPSSDRRDSTVIIMWHVPSAPSWMFLAIMAILYTPQVLPWTSRAPLNRITRSSSSWLQQKLLVIQPPWQQSLHQRKMSEGAIVGRTGSLFMANDDETINDESEALSSEDEEETIMEIANALTSQPLTSPSGGDETEDETPTKEDDEQDEQEVTNFMEKAEEAWKEATPISPPAAPKVTVMKAMLAKGAGARESFLLKKGSSPSFEAQTTKGDEKNGGGTVPKALLKAPLPKKTLVMVGNKSIAKAVVGGPSLSTISKGGILPQVPDGVKKGSLPSSKSKGIALLKGPSLSTLSKGSGILPQVPDGMKKVSFPSSKSKGTVLLKGPSLSTISKGSGMLPQVPDGVKKGSFPSKSKGIALPKAPPPQKSASSSSTAAENTVVGKAASFLQGIAVPQQPKAKSSGIGGAGASFLSGLGDKLFSGLKKPPSKGEEEDLAAESSVPYGLRAGKSKSPQPPVVGSIDKHRYGLGAGKVSSQTSMPSSSPAAKSIISPKTGPPKGDFLNKMKGEEKKAVGLDAPKSKESPLKEGFTEKGIPKTIQLTEGITAEEAAQAREARLTGKSIETEDTPILITEGLTAEEAEAVRQQRVKQADEVAKTLPAEKKGSLKQGDLKRKDPEGSIGKGMPFKSPDSLKGSMPKIEGQPTKGLVGLKSKGIASSSKLNVPKDKQLGGLGDSKSMSFMKKTPDSFKGGKKSLDAVFRAKQTFDKSVGLGKDAVGSMGKGLPFKSPDLLKGSIAKIGGQPTKGLVGLNSKEIVGGIQKIEGQTTKGLIGLKSKGIVSPPNLNVPKDTQLVGAGKEAAGSIGKGLPFKSLTEGITAEEAAQAREARLTGKSIETENSPPNDVALITEGLTAEEAEAVRQQRVKQADEVAKTLPAEKKGSLKQGDLKRKDPEGSIGKGMPFKSPDSLKGSMPKIEGQPTKGLVGLKSKGIASSSKLNVPKDKQLGGLGDSKSMSFMKKTPDSFKGGKKSLDAVFRAKQVFNVTFKAKGVPPMEQQSGGKEGGEGMSNTSSKGVSTSLGSTLKSGVENTGVDLDGLKSEESPSSEIAVKEIQAMSGTIGKGVSFNSQIKGQQLKKGLVNVASKGILPPEQGSANKNNNVNADGEKGLPFMKRSPFIEQPQKGGGFAGPKSPMMGGPKIGLGSMGKGMKGIPMMGGPKIGLGSMGKGMKGMPFAKSKEGVSLPPPPLKTLQSKQTDGVGGGFNKGMPFMKKSAGLKEGGMGALKTPLKGEIGSASADDEPELDAGEPLPTLKSPLVASPSKDSGSLPSTPFPKTPLKGEGFAGPKSPMMGGPKIGLGSMGKGMKTMPIMTKSPVGGTSPPLNVLKGKQTGGFSANTEMPPTKKSVALNSPDVDETASFGIDANTNIVEKATMNEGVYEGEVDDAVIEQTDIVIDDEATTVPNSERMDTSDSSSAGQWTPPKRIGTGASFAPKAFTPPGARSRSQSPESVDVEIEVKEGRKGQARPPASLWSGESFYGTASSRVYGLGPTRPSSGVLVDKDKGIKGDPTIEDKKREAADNDKGDGNTGSKQTQHSEFEKEEKIAEQQQQEGATIEKKAGEKRSWIEEQNLEKRLAEEKAKVSAETSHAKQKLKAEKEEMEAERVRAEEEANRVDEQNLLVQKRLEQRLAEEKAKVNAEISHTKQKLKEEHEKMEAERVRARAKEEARWVEEQNLLVQEKLDKRLAEEKAKVSAEISHAKQKLKAEKEKMEVERRARAKEEAHWIEEQNLLVQERLEQRLAKEKAKLNAEISYAKLKLKKEREKMEVERRARAKEEARWTKEQNLLIEERLDKRLAEEKAKVNVEISHAKQKLKEEHEKIETDRAQARAKKEARWIEEQNLLVKKRLDKRLAEEKAKVNAEISHAKQKLKEESEKMEAERVQARAEEESRWIEELDKRLAKEKAKVNAEIAERAKAEEAERLETLNRLVEERLQLHLAELKEATGSTEQLGNTNDTISANDLLPRRSTEATHDDIDKGIETDKADQALPPSDLPTTSEPDLMSTSIKETVSDALATDIEALELVSMCQADYDPKIASYNTYSSQKGEDQDICLLPTEYPFVSLLRDSSPYIVNHRHSTIVYHISGDLISNAAQFNRVMDDIALTWLFGMKIVLCVGCRKQLLQRLERLHGKTDNVGSASKLGVRVTTPETLRMLEEEAGFCRFEVERLLNRCLRNKGADCNVVSGCFITAKKHGVVDGVNYQHTGYPTALQTDRIHRFHSRNDVVLLTPLGFTKDGDALNIHSEALAAFTAGALEASKLVYFSSNPMVLRGSNDANSNQRIQMIQRSNALQILSHYGLNVDTKTGFPHWRTAVNSDDNLNHDQQAMLLKMGWATHAIDRGVERAHIIDCEDGALLDELFTARRGYGTCISQDGYEAPHPKDRNDDLSVTDEVGAGF